MHIANGLHSRILVLTVQMLLLVCNAPINVNLAAPFPTQADPRNYDGERFVCQNPHPAISFHCQSPLPKDLYFYHL